MCSKVCARCKDILPWVSKIDKSTTSEFYVQETHIPRLTSTLSQSEGDLCRYFYHRPFAVQCHLPGVSYIVQLFIIPCSCCTAGDEIISLALFALLIVCGNCDLHAHKT